MDKGQQNKRDMVKSKTKIRTEVWNGMDKKGPDAEQLGWSRAEENMAVAWQVEKKSTTSATC